MKENLTLLVLFGSLGATALLATLLGCQSAIAFGTMPTPAITLATGTYEMPQSTTIKDSISVASIRWCYAATGNCTPTTAYTGAISATASETICAYATESGYTQSSTGCNTYVAGNYISFTYSAGQVTMSTLLPGASIFYTLDGSTATEASIEYVGNPVTVASGTTINAVAVQTTSGGITGVTVQNASALRKSNPVALVKSYPHREHDLAQSKGERSDIIHAGGVIPGWGGLDWVGWGKVSSHAAGVAAACALRAASG